MVKKAKTSTTVWFDDFVDGVYTTMAKAKVKKKPASSPKALMANDIFDIFNASSTPAPKKKTISKAMKAFKEDFEMEDDLSDSSLKKPTKKEGKERVERIFKMSDFKFPPVKRVNSQLACKTLQTDLGADILEDIGGLKI
jgi:hypothetical protein